MTLVVVLLLLAVVFGGIGLFVEAVGWLLIIAVALVVASVVMGFIARGRARV